MLWWSQPSLGPDQRSVALGNPMGVGVALAMIGQKSLLDTWWKVSGIFAGGMLGLFLLGLISRKANNAAAATGVILGVLVICWMTFADFFPENLRSPFHTNMITVIGTLTIFLVGLGVSRLREGRPQNQS